MRGSQRNRLLALIVLVALVFASSTYLFHGPDVLGAKHDDTPCTLCLHLSGTAGSPHFSGPIGTPARVIRLGPSEPRSLPFSSRRAGLHLPRGPPATV